MRHGLNAYIVALGMATGLLVGCSDTSVTSSTPSNTPKPKQNNTTAVAPANNPATTSSTSKPKPAADNSNIAFLKAVNGITYNTFVEASNVGDQLIQVGKSQESMGEFSDFMDTDRTLWGQYIDKITATKPQDEVLYTIQQQILSDLTKLQHDAQSMENAATNNDPSSVTSTSQDMLVAFKDIKQAYSQAVSEMSKYGIQASWTPNG
jgi:hypothetical protein